MLLLPLAACGHPATVSECDVIVERITQLELKKRTTVTDRKIVEQEVADTKKSLHDQMMKDCVGRRITDRAMRCVRDANSTKQIIDECFN
jgi:hypothetical protein